jgi:radical SAM superfamily enzyme YgiQ (UPF0313 family)
LEKLRISAKHYTDKKEIYLETWHEFEITMTEIIPKNLTADIVSLMAEAGITNTQIGLEAVSSTLLNKIRKKQSVAENLYYIKEALKSNIKVSGLNIIMDTLDENDFDIIESIECLYFFRFFLNDSDFSFNIVNLAVANNSYYFRQLKESGKLSEFSFNPLLNNISDRLLHDIDKYSLFDFFTGKGKNDLWDQFDSLQKIYRNMKYKYTIIYDKNKFIYKEFSKRRLIKNIIFDDQLTLSILCYLQDKVFSFDDLFNRIKEKLIDLSESQLKSVIDDLHNEGLVYYTNLYEHITTNININTKFIIQ